MISKHRVECENCNFKSFDIAHVTSHQKTEHVNKMDAGSEQNSTYYKKTQKEEKPQRFGESSGIKVSKFT